MDGEVGGLYQDWEVLHNLDSSFRVNSSKSFVENSNNFGGIEDDSDSEGIVRSNYFSLDNQGRYAKTAADCDVSEVGSVESDNPSWIDPVSENRYSRKNSGEFWSDSASDRSDERKFSDIDAKTESNFAISSRIHGGLGEMSADSENFSKLSSGACNFSGFDLKDEFVLGENAKIQADSDDFSEIQIRGKDLSSSWTESCGDELVSVKFGELGKESETSLGYSVAGNDSSVESNGGDCNSDENEAVSVVEMKPDENFGAEEKKRRIVWWKVPFEVLKYCVFRVSPVCSFSVAAAVIGFFILGRRLYKMKRKSRSLQLKVTIDDKKVSQFMSRAARLNEAFSVVRRVPIVRPSLPAAGVNPWPVMSMR